MRKALLALSVASVFMLAGCTGGDTTSSTSSGTSSVTYEIINGTFVYPVNATQALNVNCPNVPPGYAPVDNTTVSIMLNGQVIATATTDACGYFDINVASDNYTIQVNVNGTSVTIPETALDVANSTVTVPVNTSTFNIIINKIDTSSGKVYLNVSDNTGKAIIGIPLDNVTIKLDGVLITPTTWTIASNSEPAYVVMVMDASGSMDDTIDYVNYKTKFEYAAMAAKYIIDNKPLDDNYGFVVFSGCYEINYINGTFTNNLNIIDKNTNQTASISYPDSGFTTEKDLLNLAGDIYNPYSPLYDYYNSTYPYYLDYYYWGGSTALIDATYKGVEVLSEVNSTRKFVITMTDGLENDSILPDEYEVIQAATTNGTTIYSIGIGSDYDIDKQLLQEFANGTGGMFYQIDPETADPISILDPFISAFSNISYQYEMEIPNLSNLTPGNHTLEVEINYLGINGTLTYNFSI